MGYSDILYGKADGVARITINRPEVYNAIRGKTTDEMAVALEDAATDEAIRVVVIAGAGPNAFCSGRDQSEDRSSPEYSGTVCPGWWGRRKPWKFCSAPIRWMRWKPTESGW